MFCTKKTEDVYQQYLAFAKEQNFETELVETLASAKASFLHAEENTKI